MTVHSRNAHNELAILLDEYSVGPVCFNYYVGGPQDADKLSKRGHFFSVNQRMLTGKHRILLDAVPMDRVLVETDGPFLTKNPLTALRQTYSALSAAWGFPPKEIENQIERNFQTCRTRNSF